MIVERRINLRLLSYWEKLRHGRAMPSEEEVKADDLPDLWDCCFIIRTSDLYKEPANCTYSYLGQTIIDSYHQGHTKGDSGKMISPSPANSSQNFRQVIENAKPLLEEGEFNNQNGELVKYRQCLLPLGRGDTVEAIFGGMSFKIF